MSEAALKAKSIAAERKAFVAATFAYESGAKLQNTKAEVINGDVDMSKLTNQVRSACLENSPLARLRTLCSLGWVATRAANNSLECEQIQNDLHRFRAEVESFSCAHLEVLKDQTAAITTSAHLESGRFYILPVVFLYKYKCVAPEHSIPADHATSDMLLRFSDSMTT